VTEKLDETEVNVATTMVTATAIKVVDSDGATASAVLHWSISGKGRKSKLPVEIILGFSGFILFLGFLFALHRK
jgi:hypothetical protein